MRTLTRAIILSVAAILLTACAGTNVVADKARRFDQATAAYDAGDYAAAYRIWRQLADENDLAAMRNAAHLLRKGQGVDKNPERALDYYTEAGRKGLVLAMANVAEMHMNGEGTLKDPEEAARWYTLAANGGLSIAMVRLAEMYEQGLGVRKDPERAREFYSRAAKNGFGPAQAKAQLPGPVSAPAPQARAAAVAPAASAAPAVPAPSLKSSALPSSVVSSPLVTDDQDRKANGRRGTPSAPAATPAAPLPPAPPIDAKAAAAMAPQDSQRFQAGLVAYQAGQATDAFKLWRGLAEKGVAEAQFRIADMFEYGRGVGRDPIEAYRWYKAASSVHEMASTAMARLGSQLTAAERAIAESMAIVPARSGNP
jgi:TPR repeat protein